MVACTRRTERGKALLLACRNADSVCGRQLELEHFLNRHGVDIFLLNETFLSAGQAFRPAKYVCHHRDRLNAGRHSLPGPPWYSSTLTARSGPNPLGGYCHSSHIGRQTGDNPCGLTFAFPSTDRRGPDCLLQMGWLGLMAGDIKNKHVDWNSRWSTRRGNAYVIMPTRNPVWSWTHQQPIQPIRHSRCLGHCHNQETIIFGISYFVSALSSHHLPVLLVIDTVSLILSSPTGSPWL